MVHNILNLIYSLSYEYILSVWNNISQTRQNNTKSHLRPIIEYIIKTCAL